MTVARKNQESTMKRHAGGSKAPPKSHRFKKTAIVIMVLALSFIAVGVVIGARYATDLMALPQLAQRRNSEHGGTWVRLSAVSPWFTQALIATEDESFYTNWGVSFEGTLRAIWVDIRSRRFAEGGSTLTQELVRDLLLSPKKNPRAQVHRHSTFSLHRYAVFQNSGADHVRKRSLLGRWCLWHQHRIRTLLRRARVPPNLSRRILVGRSTSSPERL